MGAYGQRVSCLKGGEAVSIQWTLVLTSFLGGNDIHNLMLNELSMYDATNGVDEVCRLSQHITV